MKIAVTSEGTTLSDQVDPRFGRCAHFMIVETDTIEFEAIGNSNAGAGGGAGIQSAQLMSERDVKVVLTGSCGPNAFRTLNAAGIEVVTGVGGSVQDAIEKFKAGDLSSSTSANVAGHFGMQKQQ